MNQSNPEKNTSRHRLFIVDDHPLVREGLANLINQQPDLVVGGHAQAAAHALADLAAGGAVERPGTRDLSFARAGTEHIPNRSRSASEFENGAGVLRKGQGKVWCRFVRRTAPGGDSLGRRHPCKIVGSSWAKWKGDS